MSTILSLLFTKDFYGLPQTVQREVYREFYRLVFPMIFYIVKDYQASEDIIQESFLRAIDKAQQFNELGAPEAWLKAVARSVSLNYLRKFRRNRDELDPSGGTVIRETPDPWIHSVLEEEVEAKLLKEDILRYMDVLKPEYRQMIEMRWGSSLSYKEIAETMGLTENVVRQKLYRAREAMKRKLYKDWGIR